MQDPVEALIEAVLYDGHLVWPYRPSPPGSLRRSPFRGLYPAGYHSASPQEERPNLICQCLVEGARPREISIELRFLHQVHRQVLQRMGEQERPVDELRAGGELFLTWDEAVERRSTLPPTSLGELAATPLVRRLAFPGGAEREAIRGARGERVGTLHRSWESLAATVRLAAQPVRRGVFRLSAEVTNHTDWEGLERAGAHRHTLLSAHLLLTAHGARFVSTSDPPRRLARAAAGCRNQGVWPVLVGDPRARDRVLASPILLEDFPRIPEALAQAPSRRRSALNQDTVKRSLLPTREALA
jgi:hypothetical protein